MCRKDEFRQKSNKIQTPKCERKSPMLLEIISNYVIGLKYILAISCIVLKNNPKYVNTM